MAASIFPLPWPPISTSVNPPFFGAGNCTATLALSSTDSVARLYATADPTHLHRPAYRRRYPSPPPAPPLSWSHSTLSSNRMHPDHHMPPACRSAFPSPIPRASPADGPSTIPSFGRATRCDCRTRTRLAPPSRSPSFVLRLPSVDTTSIRSLSASPPHHTVDETFLHRPPIVASPSRATLLSPPPSSHHSPSPRTTTGRILCRAPATITRYPRIPHPPRYRSRCPLLVLTVGLICDVWSSVFELDVVCGV